MKKIYISVVLMAGLFGGTAGAAEYPIMEKVASKIVQKYQQSSCEQLW